MKLPFCIITKNHSMRYLLYDNIQLKHSLHPPFRLNLSNEADCTGGIRNLVYNPAWHKPRFIVHVRKNDAILNMIN